MNRYASSITLMIAVLVVAVAVPLAAASVISDDTVQSESDVAAESVAPGEQLAASVGAHNAEIEGEVSERAFGLAVANAETDEAKATLIAERVATDETRLEALETRLKELQDARDEGTISEGRYHAEVATVVAEMGSIERRAGIADSAAGSVPADVLSEQGVDTDAIESLRERAGERGGADTAETARLIVGDGVGESMSDDRRSDRGNESTASNDS
ncbi:hypothetical protein ACLI4R_15065 [Natrialbaceae archaeon A-chndr2]|uniref:Uncharacterized protein n=1 Tax=Natronosalvus hydrolyticus TaxID=2979988 RepID=A0AAP3E8P4_9EURY|nr:hypothetical protein [Halobacteria archaeon AArc-curdl1]